MAAKNEGKSVKLPEAKTGASKSSAEQASRDALRLLADTVIQTLGLSHEHCRVKVHPLWENHYRVNIYNYAGSYGAAIDLSYFIRLDANMRIQLCEPKLPTLPTATGPFG